MRVSDRAAGHACQALRPTTALSRAACRYHEHANNTDLDSHVVAEDRFHLGRWADRRPTVRVLSNLPTDREAELDAIGFDRKVPRTASFDSKPRRMLLEITATVKSTVRVKFRAPTSSTAVNP